MFGISSPIDKLIAAFGAYRTNSKKYEQSRYRAFECMGEWARKDNNIAIEDVAIRMEQLFCRFNTDFAHEKINAVSSMSNMFKRFKKFDMDMKKFQKQRLALVYQEEKYKKKIRECPAHKNIRDYEVKFEKVKRQRELAEFKLDQLSTEIESTKSILFKRELLRFNEISQRQADAEQVLFVAMKDLLEQIPDITSEEVDDLSTIRYENKAVCAEICVEAKRRMSTLSMSRLESTTVTARVATTTGATSNGDSGQFAESIVINESITASNESTNVLNNISSIRPQLVQVSSFRSPAKTPSANSTSQLNDTRRSGVSIFPRLDLIAEHTDDDGENKQRLEEDLESTSNTPPQTPPPPTYSDSESQYSCMRTTCVRTGLTTTTSSSSFTTVTPSAPESTAL